MTDPETVTYRVPWSEVEHLFAISPGDGASDADRDPRGMTTPPGRYLMDQAASICTSRRDATALARHAEKCRWETLEKPCPTCKRFRGHPDPRTKHDGFANPNAEVQPISARGGRLPRRHRAQ